MTAKAIAVQSTEPLTAMSILGRAVESGASVETIEKLMGLQERWESNNALKAYNDAIAQARAEIPVIFKANEKTGMGGSYKYEDLGSIARIIDPILSKHGLSYRFKSESNGEVRITCVITHRDGHSEENSLTTKPDTTGSKNAVQALGSAVTYLQRYTLKLALGIATSKDDDGGASGHPLEGNKGLLHQHEPKATSAYAARKTGIYPILEGEIRSLSTLADLKTWWSERQDDIKSLPPQHIALIEEEKDRAKLRIADTLPLTDRLTESLKLTAEEAEVIDPVTSEITEDAAEAGVLDPDKYLNDLDAQMHVCKTDADLDEVWKEHETLADTLFPPDQDAAQLLFEKHEARLKATAAVDQQLSDGTLKRGKKPSSR